MDDVGLSAWRCGFLLIRQLTVNVLRKMKNVPAAFRDENSSDSSSKGHTICRGFNEIEFHQQLVKHMCGLLFPFLRGPVCLSFRSQLPGH